jgi:cyclopropane fatty-acyl-phospholipid synthase-like methyltransferase
MNTQELAATKMYFGLMIMNGGARVYRTAQDLGVFDALRQGAAGPEAIAARCGLDVRPLRLVLDVLCSLHTLRCDDGCYSLTPLMQFLSGSYRNLSDEYWDHLPQLLETGAPLAKMDSAEQSEEQYQKQVTSLAWMMKPAAEAAAAMLGMGKSRRSLNILDVGAGAAVWSLTFAEKDAGMRVTALDWPAVLTIAAASAQRMGLEERFTPLPGNYHEVDLPDDTFDLAIVGNVAHIETPDGIVDLFRKVCGTLKTRGEIVVFDIMAGQEQGDLARTLYALGLALRTEKGQLYSPEEIEQSLRQTGFAETEFSPIGVPPYTMGMVLARKGE